MRQIARLVLLGGAVVLGLHLFRASPRDVTLVYDFGRAAPHALTVEIVKDGRTVRQAELRRSPEDPGQVVHRVRLADGEYTVRLIWDRGGQRRSLERRVTVEESGPVVLAVER